MDILKTTPEELRRKAHQIDEASAKINTLTNSLFATVNDINGTVWTGDAKNAYTKQFDMLKDDAQKMKVYTKELSDKLEAIANEYSKNEESAVQISQGLPADVIG